jgi:putative ABC transport system ATP-binding protein
MELPRSGEPLLELTDIRKEYGSDGVVTPVLNGISLRVERGEFLAIMGPSGSGKSTLLHIIGLLDLPTSGQYRLAGRLVNEVTDDAELAEARSQQIGFVFQSFNLLPRTTVLDNVALPLLYSRQGSARRYEVAAAAIESVGLTHRLHHYSNQLSGGEKQRVAIARALVNDPALLLADEPTGNLDSRSGVQVMDVLWRLNEAGRTVVLVTHETMTAEYAQRIVKMRDGLITADEAVASRRRVADGRTLK